MSAIQIQRDWKSFSRIKTVISWIFSGSYGSSSYGSSGGGYKKKSKTKSRLKKAAVIGATAYGAYQLGKLSGRFRYGCSRGPSPSISYDLKRQFVQIIKLRIQPLKMTIEFRLPSSYSHGGGYGWNDYNRWREIDGFLCRDSNDCSWIDRQLYCQDYELDFQPSVSLQMAQPN